MIRSYCVSVTPPPPPPPPLLPLPLNRTPTYTYPQVSYLFEPSSSSWHPNFSSPPTPPAKSHHDWRLGWYCILPVTHEILSSRQYILSGLKKVRDTECSEHTAIRPAVPSLCPPHLLRHSKVNQFCRFVFRKRDLFLY